MMCDIARAPQFPGMEGAGRLPIEVNPPTVAVDFELVTFNEGANCAASALLNWDMTYARRSGPRRIRSRALSRYVSPEMLP
jgi:hypothetical protein